MKAIAYKNRRAVRIRIPKGQNLHRDKSVREWYRACARIIESRLDALIDGLEHHA